jgi:hypothetical protein
MSRVRLRPYTRGAGYGLCMAFIGFRKPALAVADVQSWPDEHYYISYFVSVNKIEKKLTKNVAPLARALIIVMVVH